MKKHCLLLIISLFLSFLPYANADIVTTKSGEVIVGKITDQTATHIRIESSAGVPYSINLNDIKSMINNPEDDMYGDEELYDEADMYEDDVLGDYHFEDEYNSAGEDVIHADFSDDVIEYDPVKAKRKQPGNMAVKTTVFMFLMYGLLMHFTIALPLYVLGVRHKESSRWVAWIPIAQFYLTCSLGERPTWWMMFFMIPFVGWLLHAWVWVGIAEAEEKPSWLGWLMVIPSINLLLPWYFALSKSK